MVQVLAITDYIDSLAEVETRLGLYRAGRAIVFY